MALTYLVIWASGGCGLRASGGGSVTPYRWHDPDGLPGEPTGPGTVAAALVRANSTTIRRPARLDCRW